MYAATLNPLLFFGSYIIIIAYIKAAVLFIFLVAVIIRNEDVVFAVQKRLINTVHSSWYLSVFVSFLAAIHRQSSTFMKMYWSD